MEIRTLAEGLEFPEGPVALEDGSVLVVEIAAGRLTRVMPGGAKTVAARPGGGPNGAAIGPDGKCYVCNNGGFEWVVEGRHRRPFLQARDYAGGRIERVDLATGAVECLCRAAGEVSLKGPNDLVFDRHGGFYFSDLGKVRAREMDRGAVYYAKADGSAITEVAFPMVTPNGVGLSPDGTTLYVAETEAARLWAFDIVEPGGRAQRAVAVAAWRPARRRGRRLSALRLAGTRRRGSNLRRDADQWRNHGDFARRPACRAPSDARPDDDQHLLWRVRHADRVYYPVVGRALGRGRLAGPRAAAQSVGVRRRPSPRARMRDPGAVAASAVGALDRDAVVVEPQRHRTQPP